MKELSIQIKVYPVSNMRQDVYRFMADEFLTQGIKTAHTFFHIDLTVMINGDTAGIIPAIFQFTQSINQKRGSLMAPNISNNSAHSLCLLMK